MAFVVLPEAPLAAWLAALKAQIDRAPGFFDARPVILDLSQLNAGTEGVATLLKDMEALGIGVIDVENAPDLPGPAMDGVDPWKRRLVGGRNAGPVEIKPAATPEPASAPGLIVEDHIRSGQSVVFPKGDVTVLGSVSSGAEILAGGSIHIYGALRGRALAGAQGFAKARIFCRRLEAELLSIDGFYLTAEDIDPKLRGQAVQIGLESGRIVITEQR